MCTCLQTGKTPAGSPGNFNYTFKCTTSSGVEKEIQVTSSNDSQAMLLAELECVDKSTELGVQIRSNEGKLHKTQFRGYLQKDKNIP